MSKQFSLVVSHLKHLLFLLCLSDQRWETALGLFRITLSSTVKQTLCPDGCKTDLTAWTLSSWALLFFSAVSGETCVSIIILVCSPSVRRDDSKRRVACAAEANASDQLCFDSAEWFMATNNSKAEMNAFEASAKAVCGSAYSYQLLTSLFSLYILQVHI